ncbi:hypothetical protein CK203_044265 [Vitis vinifera]|uniref:Uncharacterized protein n=1 Tax=Vitis vinifera TaxID=29760 RepID=A0A438GVA3_VITVI|nr:hypothetical protein CK203_044265 [Vitis vinifera]
MPRLLLASVGGHVARPGPWLWLQGAPPSTFSSATLPTALPPPKPLLKSEKEEEVSWREREKEKLRRMAATEVVKSGETEGEGEEQRLLEGVAVLDFDMLCSTVALQAQGKWTKFDHNGNGDDEDSGEFGGVFRMWEGELLDCFEDRRIAIQTACCPCYRFGKNMRRAGFGSCFIQIRFIKFCILNIILQGTVYFILSFSAFLSCIAFFVTKRHCFLYMAVAFTISIGTYMGFFRTQIKKKFNIRDFSLIQRLISWLFSSAFDILLMTLLQGGDSSLDDCVYHLICPCCTLCQESRTLEMNNVQDGTWHGRGDTICIGSYGESSKAFFELHPPPLVSTKSPEPCSMQKSTDSNERS